jgi:hypothetical protein
VALPLREDLREQDLAPSQLFLLLSQRLSLLLRIAGDLDNHLPQVSMPLPPPSERDLCHRPSLKPQSQLLRRSQRIAEEEDPVRLQSSLLQALLPEVDPDLLLLLSSQAEVLPLSLLAEVLPQVAHQETHLACHHLISLIPAQCPQEKRCSTHSKMSTCRVVPAEAQDLSLLPLPQASECPLPACLLTWAALALWI